MSRARNRKLNPHYNGQPPEDPPGPDSDVQTRVGWCTHLMATGYWSGRKSHKELAEAWNCAVSTVESYAAEASRRLTLDPKALEVERALHAAYCDRIRCEALESVSQVTGLPDYGNALKAVELGARFRGLIDDKRTVELTGKGGGPVAVTFDEIDAALAAADMNASNRKPSGGEGGSDGSPAAAG